MLFVMIRAVVNLMCLHVYKIPVAFTDVPSASPSRPPTALPTAAPVPQIDCFAACDVRPGQAIAVARGNKLGTVSLPHYFVLTFDVYNPAIVPPLSSADAYSIFSLIYDGATTETFLSISTARSMYLELRYLNAFMSAEDVFLPDDYASTWVTVSVRVKPFLIEMLCNGVLYAQYANNHQYDAMLEYDMYASDDFNPSAGGSIRNIAIKGEAHSFTFLCADKTGEFWRVTC